MSKPVVGIFGTSIAEGIGATGGESYHVIALKAARMPYMVFGKGGESMSILNGTTNHAVRYALARFCTDIICEHGVNDGISGAGASLATYQSRYQTLWAALHAINGARVWQCTMPPSYNTSSDSWLTTGNQGVSLGETVREQANDWIRAGAGGNTNLQGYFEIADILETARNSGIWHADGTTGGKYTTDGVHPSGTGHTLAAAGINTTAIQAAFDVATNAPTNLLNLMKLGGTLVKV